MRKLVFGTILLALISTTASAEDIDGSFIYDGQTRTYLLHLPPSYNEENPLPLVINLHFYGGNGLAQSTITGMSTKADEVDFIVVYPDALGTPSSWDMYDDVGFISALIDTLQSAYAIDTLRIYATGFSNGGFMAHILACELESRIAAAAPVAGAILIEHWGEFPLSRPVPTIHFHARNDPAVPYEGNEYYAGVEAMASTWAAHNGCTLGPDTFYNEAGALRQRWYRADDSCEVILWTTEDGGHTWPGSSSGSQAVSANDEMWEFFCAHPMPVGIEEPNPTNSCSPHINSPALFTNSATIRFSLDSREHVSLELFDVLGTKVRTVIDQVLEAGEHAVVLDAAGLSTGVYFCRLNTSKYTETRSIRLVD